MMKIKKIKLSGFRGILTEQELNLVSNGSQPASLAVYGLNSSGKTSFVDGLEWFLTPTSEIEWLKRENAGSHAYPHQEAKDGETFVEIEFSNSEYGVLTKTFNSKKVTIPTLSSEDKFNELYKSFTIRPYLRYLEIIDFVFNRTGVEKYQKLANWMGFEEELSFQEKIALGIIPVLREKQKNLTNNNDWIEGDIKRLLQIDELTDNVLLECCNSYIKQIGLSELGTLEELPQFIKDLDKKRSNLNTSTVAVIIKAQTNLLPIKLDSDLVNLLKELDKQIISFNEKKELADKIEYVHLYEKAYEIIEKQNGDDIECPVCGLNWKRVNLINHIHGELELLKEVKDSHDKILKSTESIKTILGNEIEQLKLILSHLQTVKDVSVEINHEGVSVYKQNLEDVLQSISISIFESEVQSSELEVSYEVAVAEIKTLTDLLNEEKEKLQPTKEEVLINEAVEKLRTLNEKLNSRNVINHKIKFYSEEINNCVAIGDEFFRLVQEDIVQRFSDVSSQIEKYFKILRQDKDIKDVEITLNLDKSRAVGRSAEIQLSYYDLIVKPAYKVLSESLLNSLGLAVYFTCVKRFNEESKFVVLDDIMNSLDMGHRDTLLDLLEQEFSDYQVILFTHDLHWFERIQRRFPGWLHKKIKNWNYLSGPKIDKSNTSLEEISKLLEDSTKAQDAGRDFGVYVENILNDLCEQLHAELRYRYIKHDPPSTEELFTALYKRLKDKLSKNTVVELVKNAQKYEPLIRNATSHSRQNYNSSITPDEVKRAISEWLKLEQALWCSSCNKFVEYKRDRDQIECRCGNVKLERVM